MLPLLCFILPLFLSFGLFSSASHNIQLQRRNSTGLTDDVTWDSQSLSILGQRVFILSAEFHPWRLPNPNLWADIFQKIRANGFNTVSFYVNWALHFPTPDTNGGQGDFESGTYRDIQRFIDEAEKAGLWLIARPGPYINGETTGGGFPGWVGNVAGSLRTDNPNYTQAWLPYMTAISKIIAKNQITNGGPIILVQAENEFSAGSTHSDYMQHVIDTYRSNGIVIPITHNDQHAGSTGNFSPDLPGTGRVNIYCGDSYPQGSSRWAQVQTVYFSNHKAVAPNNPLCLAEFGGGFLLGWNGAAKGGTGYEKYSGDLTNADYENVFYKDAYAQTTTIFNIYMLFGGTNWGQTAEPTVYSSYDYGGGINENRVAGPKMNEMRLQGLFLRVSRDLLSSNLLGNGTNFTSSNLIHTAELRNPKTNAGFYFLRHDDATSTALTATTLTVTTSSGQISIPKSGQFTLNGRESKIIVTDYVFGASETRILYSTAEIMTWTTIGTTDYIILYVLPSQQGETTFIFSGTPPTVDLSNAPNIKQITSESTITLNYVLNGTSASFVSFSGSGNNLVVMIMDKPTASSWHAVDISSQGNFGAYFSIGTNQSVLVGGPYLVRSASISGDTLSLTGDLNGTTPIEFITPESITKLSWNGEAQNISPTDRKSFTATLSQNASPVTLPQLTGWKVTGSLPEINPTFDDSAWVVATQSSTNYTNLPPLISGPVLYAQQYGFYGGNLILRGHFNLSSSVTLESISSTVQGGFGFAYSAFLNGVFLGSHEGNSTVSGVSDVWSIPANAPKSGENVLVILQDNMGIVETSTNGGKEPRGIRGVTLTVSSGTNPTFAKWTIQGNQGGASATPDSLRGYLNEGGLYFERIGAHLPGFEDANPGIWKELNSTSLSVGGAGVNVFKTTFDLNIPTGIDVPIRLSFPSTTPPSSPSSNFRAQIYINGWQVGKFINDLGPQTDFVLPLGLLHPSSTNTLVISLWSISSSGSSLPIDSIKLISDGTFSSALLNSEIDLVGDEYQFNAPGREKALPSEVVGIM
ncbi:glycoside hydrolase family 35 protein [Abortiporus biennis]|nr:glycoside hydrolase family 35 protein [Abortiporus biennis]